MKQRSPRDSSLAIPWDCNAFRAHSDLAAKYLIVSRKLVYEAGKLVSVVVTYRPKPL